MGDNTDARRVLICYDCCVPKNSFRDAMLARIPWADHRFISNGKTWSRDDYEVIERVLEIWREKFYQRPEGGLNDRKSFARGARAG